MTDADINIHVVCRVCGESKILELFPKMPTGKYGRTTRCKPCTAPYMRAYQEVNSEKLKARYKKRYAENKEEYNAASKANYEKNKPKYIIQAKQWAAGNKEKRREAILKWDSANRDKKAIAGKKHREENPGLYRAHFKMRQQRKRNAMPAWADEAAMRWIYDECSRVSKETGVKHHVDHYFPLKNDIVCGLHNQFNLRIITALENLSKGNSFPMEEL